MTNQLVQVQAGQRQAARRPTREPSLARHVLMMLRLQRFACKYFAQIDVEYQSLCADAYKEATAEEVASLREDNVSRPSWILNHRFEYLLLAGVPDEILKQRAIVHRARLMALAGPEGVAVFGEAFSPPDPKSSIDAQRTAALGVLQEVQRLRHVQSEFARLRNRLLVASLVPAVGFVSIAILFPNVFLGIPAVAAVAILGLLGGYLSVLSRLGSLQWGLKYAANYQQVDRLFWNLLLNFYLSTIQGALGAVILYFVFSANLLTSAIFPAIPNTAPGHILLVKDLFHDVFAQLMMWSVVAGFSERIAPDLLTSLGKEVTQKKAPV